MTIAPSPSVALMASTDWNSSPIGPPTQWPVSLRNIVDVMFAMPSPAFIVWGSPHTLLYNEPFRAIVEVGPAETFGRPLEVASRYFADDIVLLMRGEHAAQGTGWRTMSLRQDDGAIGGAFCVYNASEARYQTLFDSIDEGFCIIEFIDGPAGPLSDYVHVAANAAYALNTGIQNVVGQKVREMVPDEAEGWVKLYVEVLRTGQPIRFERELVATGRFLELAAFRIEPASRREVAVLFKDVTARKRAERALQELNETLEARVAAALAERKVLADIVEGTNAFVQVIDLDFRWIAINGAATREFKRLFGVVPKVGAAARPAG